MILFFFPAAPPVLIFLTLALALYLAAVELRELKPSRAWWAWWLLLVFMTHFIGYLTLRGYVAFRRAKGSRA